ncbi:MAG: lipocalin-like domain-containing protein [Prevotella sp.]|nr:lipocalin-like domain-containing protein [Prevotella sp.]
MRQYIRLLPLALLALLTACDMHSSDNGELDGYWQMHTVDTLGGKSADIRSEKIFWAVQADLLEMVQLKGDITSHRYKDMVFRFQLNNGELRVSNPFWKARNIGDEPITDVEDVKPYGLSEINQTFRVEQLNSSDMTLSTDHLRLHFRKY